MNKSDTKVDTIEKKIVYKSCSNCGQKFSRSEMNSHKVYCHYGYSILNKVGSNSGKNSLKSV